MTSTLINLLINSLAGGGGGFLGNLIKKNGLSMVANLLSGAVGGNVLPLILKAVGVLGGGAAAADAAAGAATTAASSGSFDLATLATAVLGGGAGSLLGGLFGGNKQA
jgi:hypothetical protein